MIMCFVTAVALPDSKVSKALSSSALQLHFCKVSISTVLILFSCPEFPMIAIPVTCSTIFDVERTKSLEAGKALELECEVADSTGPVCSYKDGVRLLPENGWDTLSTGTLRRLIIPSAELLHSGLHSCETSDDTSHYTVDIKGDFNQHFLNLRVNTRTSWRPDATNFYNMHICLSVWCSV